jgi:hypothetical protein
MTLIGGVYWSFRLSPQARKPSPPIAVMEVGKERARRRLFGDRERLRPRATKLPLLFRKASRNSFRAEPSNRRRRAAAVSG